MKKLSIIFFLTGCMAWAAQAQDNTRKENYPYWTISKDVQRIPYRDVTFAPARITTGTSGWIVSKGVQQKADDQKGTVAKTGYPSWIISKGVARKQFENSNK